MIPILHLANEGDRARVEVILKELRLDPVETALEGGSRVAHVATVRAILADVARRGDGAVVDLSRKFDDPDFSAGQIRVTPEETRDAVARVPADQLAAVRRSITQVREYQTHILPHDPPPLRRPGVELGLRFTPLDSVGLLVPGGKASYPSSLIMLAVPAQVAGVKRIVACSPPSKYGRSDLMLATYHELGLTEIFRAGGAGAVAAMAFGTETIPRVDKIVGPGNTFVQLAKRALAGCVGIDGYLGPSEILTLADESGRADFIAADMIAQAEHDPGSCFLLTTSERLAAEVDAELARQSESLGGADAIVKALRESSAVVVGASMRELIALANRFAAEHVNLQTRDDAAALAGLVHAGAVFVGAYSPVAAGDYVAGPSHCLPTNTTARFSSGISVYEFLKRGSVVRYERGGLAADAPSIVAMAEAEHLGGHAASVRVRGEIIRAAGGVLFHAARVLYNDRMAPSFVRLAVRQMDGYTPGEQPSLGERVVKLNTNENPFKPSDKVMQAIREVEGEMLRRYPSPAADGFRAAAAKVLGVAPNMILAGNGSDDILTIATRTFVGPGETIAAPDPTYSLYTVLAQLQDAEFKTVPWGKNYSLPVDALLATGARAIYLANPNAPTGTMVPPSAVGELARAFDGLVLVDEAYADFADENCLALVKERPNVVVSRTFSKGYSLAGLRFGYAVAQAQVIHEMLKVKDSYNCDALSVVAATAAILDQEHARASWDHVREERQRVSAELSKMGWHVLPSHANFVLAICPDGRGREAYLGLKAQGILVRYFDKPGLTDKIRITIGTSQENNALIGGIKGLSAAEKAA